MSLSDRGSTQRLLALGGLGAGALLALVAGSRAWWRASGTGVSVAFTGTETTGGLAQALALVVLAGALLGLVLRSRGRRALGVLLVLAGAGVVVLGLMHPRPTSSTVQSRVLEVSLADQFALTGTTWPYVYAVAGALATVAAGGMSITAGRWPARSSRFERPGPSLERGVRGARRAGEADPASLWRSLDAGDDPTLEGDDHHRGQPTDRAGANVSSDAEAAVSPAPEDPQPSGRPGVHERSSGVTMRPRADARTDEPTRAGGEGAA